MRWIRFLALALATTLAAGSADAQTTLRVVMHSDLKVIDPVWTTAYIVRNHGYMIYDTLFALDAKLEVQPQMVDTWSVADDKVTYTFRLRDGLEWHDGQPVTSDDVIPSIRRWAARDPLGQLMMAVVQEMAAVDARTFRVVLKEPSGLLMMGISKPSGNALFIMPRRVAETDPFTQISDTTGSGPFIFKKDEWKPGDRTVYIKNPKYRPRAEPPSGLAGGKVAKVDRVEWLAISDQQTAVNALVNREIDMIETPQHDLFGLLTKDPNIELVNTNPLGLQYIFRYNVLHKPFDNPKIRQALFYAFNQQDFLNGVIGDPKYYKTCKAMFMCDTPFASTKGWEDKLDSNMEKARALLKEGGYDGTPVVLLGTTDLQVLNNLAPVAKSLMERAGMKVDMQQMDWSTLVSRRAKKDPPAQGGWNALLTATASVDIVNPLINAFVNASCDGAWFGWACDQQLVALRGQFARAPDLATQQQIAEAIQLRAIEYPTHVFLGQWYQPIARRKSVTGNIESAVPVFWNVEKNER
ncbi:ABC transporter substrate-binding protein [Vineibacter terrae]|uniref:ABC transporter substrate-binding protein n=1 Tax=Vineibacter terrae TaxID=2586908 RepID=UPI002E3741A9|nr:ABC transporter substrate-binding protein [Vineibacter terrae]HEX2889147.1 ABC transporter substrate-binding protein [Vineibacter terrae]